MKTNQLLTNIKSFSVILTNDTTFSQPGLPKVQNNNVSVENSKLKIQVS